MILHSTLIESVNTPLQLNEEPLCLFDYVYVKLPSTFCDRTSSFEFASLSIGFDFELILGMALAGRIVWSPVGFEELKEQLQEMSEIGFIREPSVSPGVHRLSYFREDEGLESMRLLARSGLQQVAFLSIVSADGIIMDHQRLRAIHKWPRPTTVTELMRKGEKFVWTDERQESFEELKTEIFVSAPSFALSIFWWLSGAEYVDRVITHATDQRSSKGTARVICGDPKFYRPFGKDYRTLGDRLSSVQHVHSLNGWSVERTIQTLEDMLSPALVLWKWTEELKRFGLLGQAQYLVTSGPFEILERLVREPFSSMHVAYDPFDQIQPDMSLSEELNPFWIGKKRDVMRNKVIPFVRSLEESPERDGSKLWWSHSRPPHIQKMVLVDVSDGGGKGDAKKMVMDFDESDLMESLRELKRRFGLSAPILTLPSGSGGFQIYSDASKKGLGCVLMQHGKVIAYASRQLKPYEVNYPTIEDGWELLKLMTLHPRAVWMLSFVYEWFWWLLASMRIESKPHATDQRSSVGRRLCVTSEKALRGRHGSQMVATSLDPIYMTCAQVSKLNIRGLVFVTALEIPIGNGMSMCPWISLLVLPTTQKSTMMRFGSGCGSANQSPLLISLHSEEICLRLVFGKDLRKLGGTRLKFSTSFHPQTDGQSERTIQTLEDMLRACALEWKGQLAYDYLYLVEFGTTIISWHACIKAAPFELLYG
ncbi:retrotransposon protein, putative, ty3-gypsy subclass [Tanacetum coccineum]|uniref:Retrotransposon protein, putative, ty3-gypsy subclass n=1 Tax=Tanacetum coccineum TaxID=301880 RepID=A0ABQ5DVS2_9ASTR